ncbi:ADP-ribosylglycohydrolase family protein [Marinobacterium lutimaris]|uniref:ADP-ribosyl-[dinitrogen reductase] hydrolase n=1 Tax=Marinobacterium lutimaris TaxID=568106 RepID=A0A1H5ZE64_9GAMM|nr:ADP-ribosylglycohydrolase family protein [Marinobacterium lutimaris]SEG34738.1 ADP-ribosyl-[dinitrogen reductase] hydrolase [Marinobacterium lutimaris]
MEPLQSSLRGMLVGLAVGDALGAPVEFMRPGEFEPVTGYREGGPHKLPAGYWTDDTSMALCSGVSLCLHAGFNPEDQMQRFTRWFRQGYLSSIGRCFDIGNRTRAALKRFERTGDPFAGEESFDSAGNGALMRLAPVVMFFHEEFGQAQAVAREHSRLTHADIRCIEANELLAWILWSLSRGMQKEELFTAITAFADRVADVEMMLLAQGSYLRLEPPKIQGSGYVVKSLEAALWAFARSSSFAEGALLAVNLGDDADTTGAVYGQIAGAFYGHEAIPEAWRNGLFQHDSIVALSDALMRRSADPLPPDWK